MLLFRIKDTLKGFDILKTSKKVYEIMFLIWSMHILKVYSVHYSFLGHSVHWDKTQMLKKFPSDKINGTKNALFFLSRIPTHHSSTFNSQLLYEMKHKVCLSKTVCGILHFRFRFVFIRVYIFVQQNAWTLSL